MPADDFGNRSCFEVRITRVFPLWRINKEDILPYLQTTFLQARQQLLLGGTRVGSTFQRHYLTAPQIGFYRIGCIDDEAHVRFAIFIQRRRNAKNEGVTFAGPTKI
ncbi:hypothetical protein D3C75_1118140 [compost metagenome]